jgi:serine/threonine protein kinase
MSPEQVARKLYNHKVDIYSLGMIYYELLEPFYTQMERVNTLKALRSPDFSFKCSDQPEFLLVKSMLSHHPDKRPDAADILKMDFIAVSDCPRHRISESAGDH